MKRHTSMALGGLALMAISSCSLNSGNKSAAPLVFEAEDSDSIQNITAGQNFEVKLLGTPSAGYVWTVVSLPPGVILAATSSSPENPEARAQGMVGGNEWTHFRFSTMAPPANPKSGYVRGLVIHYGRPWELAGGKPAEKTWRMLIQVDPKS